MKKMTYLQTFSSTVALVGLLTLPVPAHAGRGADREEADRLDRAEELDRVDRLKDPEKVDDEIEKATEKSLEEEGRADVFDRARALNRRLGGSEEGLDFDAAAREQVDAREAILEAHAKKLAEEAEKEDKDVRLAERKGDVIAKDEDFPVSKEAKDTLDLIGRAKGAFETEGEEKGLGQTEKAAEKFAELPAAEQKHVIESEELEHVQDPTAEEREKFLKDKGRIGRFEDGDRFIGDDGQERGAKSFEAHPRAEIDRDVAEAAKRAR